MIGNANGLRSSILDLSKLKNDKLAFKITVTQAQWQ